jgi:hypothetical protein
LTKRNCLFGVGLSVAVALSATCAVAQPEDLTVNDAGLQVQYPSGVFSVPAGPTERYSGQRFTSPDGSAQFAYYSFENRRGESPANFLRRTLVMKPEQLVYRRITPSFFVVSSIRNENIFYSRCNFSRAGAIHCFDLLYPKEEERAWDAVVTRISLSLRPLEG